MERGLLDDEELQLFVCMSVFAGGATFGDAESVAGSVAGAIDSLDLIESLVNKSLLTVHQGPTGSRVMMLETIREYAAELLASDFDEATVRSAQALHYHALLASEPSIVAWPPRNALEATRLVEELPNARVALAKLQHDGRHDLAQTSSFRSSPSCGCVARSPRCCPTWSRSLREPTSPRAAARTGPCRLGDGSRHR